VGKVASLKYITITSKHHDGFAMFDSDVSDWDIGDHTAYKPDSGEWYRCLYLEK
jgi:alpha-L-fucosidase